jgi:hypothetical protein
MLLSPVGVRLSPATNIDYTSIKRKKVFAYFTQVLYIVVAQWGGKDRT